MHHGQDNHVEEPRECGRCATPMVKGHGMVCALNTVAETAFYVGVGLLVLFWIILAKAVFAMFAIADGGNTYLWAVLAAVNSGLFMLLSILCGMRAKWLRHRIVSSDENYLDAEGSCCGGSCAGSCGEGGCDDGDCGEEGCSPEGCDDEDCCKKDDGCGCGDACVCAGMGGCDDGCDSCGETCGCTDRSQEEGGCCGGGCCK